MISSDSFKAVFTHALRSRRETEPIILVIASETGEIGVGEVLPRPYLTGETVESVLQKEIPALAQRWLGREFQDRDEVVEALHRDLEFVGRALATFAGWELALLDLAGKTFHFSAGDVLGQDTGTILESGVVIDFCVPTARLEKYCMLLRLAGKRHVKVKVGLNEDLRRLAIVQEVFGNDHPLRLDANAAWTPDQAIESLHQMRRFNLCSVEQPVPAGDLAGMRKVREQTGISLVADESLCSLDDAKSLAAGGAADVFNIRIGKTACRAISVFDGIVSGLARRGEFYSENSSGCLLPGCKPGQRLGSIDITKGWDAVLMVLRLRIRPPRR